MARILIIDDEGVVRDALRAVLPQRGHEVVVAAEPAAGLRLFKEGGADLVLLDRSFAAVLKEIKEQSPQTPVIVLTGFFDPQLVEKYHKLGASHFLAKSMGLEALVMVISRTLGAPAQAKRPEGGKARVLVVDDDEQIRTILKRYLEAKGYGVETASNGVEGLRLVASWKPHLVLLDVSMPELDGIETLKRIRQSDPKVSVMMVTGGEDLEVAKECMGLGASDFIMKPLNFEYLDLSVSTKVFLLTS